MVPDGSGWEILPYRHTYLTLTLILTLTLYLTPGCVDMEDMPAGGFYMTVLLAMSCWSLAYIILPVATVLAVVPSNSVVYTHACWCQ